MDVVYRYASRVVMLKEGKICFDGQPVNLFAQNDKTLDLPLIFDLASKLNEKGYHIPLDKIRTLKDVVSYIRK